jgi:hypothetical protein
VFAAAISVAGYASAQSGGGYDLHWNVTAAGAATASGGAYKLTGTVGQHAVAVACANNYSVRSGFWAGVPRTDVIYRNGFEVGC